LDFFPPKTEKMPRRRRHSSPEITASQELVEAVGGLGVVDDEPTSPRVLTRSMTPQVAVVVENPAPGVVAGSIEMFKLDIHGIIVREESTQEYYAPQKLLFVSNGSSTQVKKIKRKIEDAVDKALADNPRTEVYTFNTTKEYPINITKVSGVDRGYGGNKTFGAYFLRDPKRRRV
jgi:hypothetical protein